MNSSRLFEPFRTLLIRKLRKPPVNCERSPPGVANATHETNVVSSGETGSEEQSNPSPRKSAGISRPLTHITCAHDNPVPRGAERVPNLVGLRLRRILRPRRLPRESAERPVPPTAINLFTRTTRAPASRASTCISTRSTAYSSSYSRLIAAPRNSLRLADRCEAESQSIRETGFEDEASHVDSHDPVDEICECDFIRQ